LRKRCTRTHPGIHHRRSSFVPLPWACPCKLNYVGRISLLSVHTLPLTWRLGFGTEGVNYAIRSQMAAPSIFLTLLIVRLWQVRDWCDNAVNSEKNDRGETGSCQFAASEAICNCCQCNENHRTCNSFCSGTSLADTEILLRKSS
jgi:hypothetical protein